MLHGIDVSDWQGPAIDWSKLRRAGITFAAIKATEGTTITDPTFRHNWQGAKVNYITRLAYHFFRPEYTGEEQAQYFHSVVHANGGTSNTDGVLLDLETLDASTPSTALYEAEQFVLTVRSLMHRQVVLYTAPYFWNELGNPHSRILFECPLWVASWGVISAPNIENEPAPAFWQYASSGVEPGIEGQVDLDYFLGNTTQLHKILTHHL